jgi:DNA-binding NtrC family response regulator
LKGETGTGKKLAAWFLHQHSKRAGEPLVTVNCAALSPTLLESELFGHEKGAFTGAHKQKLGKFEHAGQGTLFLDEIGELTPPLQSKLLRILDDREFERVGGNRTLRMECRIVTASHIDFPSALEEGRFRADLYHRLNVISVEIPTLRERREDIPLLARYFLKQKSSRHHKRITKISPKAIDQLKQYSWPGNVRELENTIERAVVLSQGQELTEVALPHTQIAEPPPPAPTSPDPTSMTLKAFRDQALEKIEGQYFDHLLTLHQGHISRASAAAGIDRKTFYRKIRKYGIDPKTYKKNPQL